MLMVSSIHPLPCADLYISVTLWRLITGTVLILSVPDKCLETFVGKQAREGRNVSPILSGTLCLTLVISQKLQSHYVKKSQEFLNNVKEYI